MPEEMSAVQKLANLRKEYQFIDERCYIENSKLTRYTDVQISRDDDLQKIQAEFDQLSLKLRTLKLEIEQLEIIVLVEEKLDTVRSLIPVGKFAINSFRKEAGEIIGEVVKAAIDVRESIDDQLARLSQITAHGRYRQFEHYMTEGFSDEQAFMLTLASIHPINWSEMAQKGNQSVSSVASKRS